MVESEREMIRPSETGAAVEQERFTSLQPTYEDSVPESADDWDSVGDDD